MTGFDYAGFRHKLELGVIAHSPRAHAKITSLPAPLVGVPVFVSTAISEGEFFFGHDVGVGGRLGRKVAFVGPLTHWRLQHPGREPMLSRCSRGVQELDRDRRRYPRPVEGA